jgi:tetraacyldisaccharide 4'-kinase
MQPPEFWSRGGTRSRLFARALAPLGAIYAATIAYKTAHARPYRSRAKVICVGNLTVGGSGKTPIVAAVAQELVLRQRRPFVLTRGYGGTEHGPWVLDLNSDDASKVGDEALMLAMHTPVIVSRDRAAGAKLAERHGADIIVMDDGHQNFSLGKDLSLVIVDGEELFGNGFVIPAGPLREPVAQGLARADAVIVMGGAHCSVPNFSGPILHARLRPAEFEDNFAHPFVAFAGIGRPQKYFRLLRELGAQTAATRAFPDHHRYTPAEIAELRQLAQQKKATLITTEKDYVRLASADRAEIRFLPIRAEFEDHAALTHLLDRLLA